MRWVISALAIILALLILFVIALGWETLFVLVLVLACAGIAYVFVEAIEYLMNR